MSQESSKNNSPKLSVVDPNAPQKIQIPRTKRELLAKLQSGQNTWLAEYRVGAPDLGMLQHKFDLADNHPCDFLGPKIKQIYQSDNFHEVIAATILNAAYACNRLVFCLTNESLAALVMADPNVPEANKNAVIKPRVRADKTKYVGFHSEYYTALTRGVLASFMTSTMSDSKGKASIFKITHEHFTLILCNKNEWLDTMLDDVVAEQEKKCSEYVNRTYKKKKEADEPIEKQTKKKPKTKERLVYTYEEPAPEDEEVIEAASEPAPKSETPASEPEMAATEDQEDEDLEAIEMEVELQSQTTAAGYLYALTKWEIPFNTFSILKIETAGRESEIQRKSLLDELKSFDKKIICEYYHAARYIHQNAKLEEVEIIRGMFNVNPRLSKSNGYLIDLVRVHVTKKYPNEDDVIQKTSALLAAAFPEEHGEEGSNEAAPSQPARKSSGFRGRK